MSELQKNVSKIPLDRIVIPERRARSTFTEEQLELLRASMKRFGLVAYPVVRPLEDGRYELIDGEHRVQAAKDAGLTEIEVVVLPADAKDAAMLNILMNLARGEQDPIGVAVAIDNAVKAGASYSEIAKAFNRSEQWVKFYHSLLELPEEYQEALKQKRLTVSHIREALRLPTAEEVDAALQTALNLNWSVTTLKTYVENRLEQLREHAAKVEAGLIEGPPPPPEPERLVKYAQCLICGRMVERNRIYLPSTCEDCYQLARYITQQVGTGQEAMRYLYNALMCYQEFQSRMQQLAYRQAWQQMQPQPPQPAPQQQPPPQPQQLSYQFQIPSPQPWPPQPAAQPQPQLRQKPKSTPVEQEYASEYQEEY